MAFCPKCGKSTDKFELCADCRPKGEPLEDKELMTCAKCEKVKLWNKWEPGSNMRDVIKKIIKKNYDFSSIQDLFIDEKKEGKRIFFKVRFRSRGKDYALTFRINKQECPSCSVQKTNYFEGVLQLRNATDNSVNFINKELDRAASKGVHVTKTTDVASGIDYYLTNKTFTINLARKLSKMFGGKISINERLFSQDKMTSKEVYRISALVELPEALDKDVVELCGHVVYVTSIAKELKGIDLLKNQKISLKYCKEQFHILQKKKTQVTKVYPHVEVLHPETFQSIKPKNFLIVDVKKDENIKIVEDSKKEIYVCEVKKLKPNKKDENL